jgi:hypothetical protein
VTRGGGGIGSAAATLTGAGAAVTEPAGGGVARKERLEACLRRQQKLQLGGAQAMGQPAGRPCTSHSMQAGEAEDEEVQRCYGA